MTSDEIQISFSTDVVVKVEPNGAHYFSYGALLYAKPILAEEIAGKVYGNEFTDFTYKPQDISKYAFAKKHKSVYKNGIIKTQLINLKRNKKETVELIPFGKTILRQTTF